MFKEDWRKRLHYLDEIEDLINLPKMVAPEPLAAIYILGIVSTAFFVSPALMILITCSIYQSTTAMLPGHQ